MNHASDIHIYQSADGQVELRVSFDQDTVWLTQAQMAALFEVKPQNITMHLKNVFSDKELDEASTCKDFLQVQDEGGRQDKKLGRKRPSFTKTNPAALI